MTALVPVEPGQWVVAFTDECYRMTDSLTANVLNLTYRGGGWDWADDHVLVVRHVTRVMPKTYEAGGRMRLYRDAVIATASTEAQADALRQKLVNIGRDADAEIDRETAKLAAPIVRKARNKALRKLESALPHIFGRAA